MAGIQIEKMDGKVLEYHDMDADEVARVYSVLSEGEGLVTVGFQRRDSEVELRIDRDQIRAVTMIYGE